MNRAWTEDALENFAKRARQLKQKLFLERYPLNTPADAKRYLREHQEYDFIVKMFEEMSCTDWSKSDFKADLR